MLSLSLARAGSTLRRRTWLVVLGWAATLAALVVLMTAFAPRARIDAYAQLIANNSFERGLAPWEETGEARVERSIEDALVGRASARAEALEEDEHFGIKYVAALSNPEQGERYVASAWVKGIRDAVGRRVTLRVDQRGADTTAPVTVTRARRLVGATWRQVRVAVPIREEGVRDVSLYVYIDDADEPRDAIFVDQVSLVRVASGEGGER